MAIEKMAMLHMVGERADLDDITKELILFGKVHIVGALSELEASHFESYLPEAEREHILENNGFKPIEQMVDFRSHYEKVERIMHHLNIPHKNMVQKLADEQGEISEAIRLLDVLYPEMEDIQKTLKVLKEKKVQLERLEALEYIESIDLDLSKLFQMNHFGMKLGLLTKENRTKLALNYENIEGIFMHLGEIQGMEAMLVAYPLDLTLEMERILRSVYFEEIEVPSDYWINTKEVSARLNLSMDLTDKEITDLEEKKTEYRKKYKEELRYSFNLLKLEMTKLDIKKQVVVSKQFVFLAGWIPKRSIEEFNKKLQKSHLNVLTYFEDQALSESYELPPTELHNNWLFRPFELLVKLYGVPSYGEIDPTPFFAVIYMILFGAMFGDVGQGFVFFAVGVAMVMLKKQPDFGALLSRLGISSMIFGTVYDSFFGYEQVISGLFSKWTGRDAESLFFIRPLENINLLLAASVAFGIFLLLIAFGYGIYNKLKTKDIKEGVFGRNGVAGLVFYLAFLVILGTAGGLIKGVSLVPFFIVCLLGMISILFREPVANLISGHRPLYHESKVDYYMESGFEAVETLLTLFSNTMSFIRVGAFALNHVGLFLAFHTLAALIGGAVGEVSMFIFGNIMILVLEGLIVFIQGLRLMFYELFSKYYTGEGFDYKPVQF